MIISIFPSFIILGIIVFLVYSPKALIDALRDKNKKVDKKY